MSLLLTDDTCEASLPEMGGDSNRANWIKVGVNRATYVVNLLRLSCVILPRMASI